MSVPPDNIEVAKKNEVDDEIDKSIVKSTKVKMIKRKNVKLSPKSKSSLMVKLRKSKWRKDQHLTQLKRRLSEDTSKDDDETDDDDAHIQEMPDVSTKSKVSQIIDNFERNVKFGKDDSKDNDAKCL